MWWAMLVVALVIVVLLVLLVWPMYLEAGQAIDDWWWGFKMPHKPDSD